MSTTLLGGGHGLPPPELGFLDWVRDATKTAKAKYPTAILIGAEGQKVTGGIRKTYDLAFSARFRVQSNKEVTVKGDSFSISSPPTNVLLGSRPDVKDMTQVKVSPWDLIADGTPVGNVEYYTSFTLVRAVMNPSQTPPLPDQPYYDLSDKDGQRLGLVGAADNKVYTI